MLKLDKRGVVFLLLLLILAITSFILCNGVRFSNHSEIVRNSIMFITLSAGLYRSGMNIIIESSYINYNGVNNVNKMSIKTLKLLFRVSTYIAIFSVAFLIIAEGINPAYTYLLLCKCMITILVVNIYCAITIFEIFMKSIEYKDKIRYLEENNR